MKSVSSLLTEERFWEIIEKSDKCNNLESELSKLSEEEILGFQYRWNYFHRKSYNQELWAVAYTVLCGCGDDCFDYFRYWLITRGQEVYEKAIQNADSLCDEFDNVEYPAWELVSYVPKQVLQEKWGKNLYDYDYAAAGIEEVDLPLPETARVWEEDDEDSIRAVCPKTFDKWWDNDKF
jgi:hypothetical protein